MVLTEEGAALWSKRLAKRGISDWAALAFAPLARKPPPRRVLLELSADGTDYAAVTEEPGEPADEVELVLAGLVRESPGLTTRELAESWPAGPGRPRLLSRRLRGLSAASRLVRNGRGHR